MIQDDELSQLLDEDMESEATLAQRLSSSPSQAPRLAHSLVSLGKTRRAAQTNSPVMDNSTRSAHTHRSHLTGLIGVFLHLFTPQTGVIL